MTDAGVFECPICYETVPKLIEAGCAHGVCPRCVLATFHATRWTCAYCRQPVPPDLRGPLVLSLLPARPDGWSHILASNPHLLDWDQWIDLLTSISPREISWNPAWFESLVKALEPWSNPSEGKRLPKDLWLRIWELLQSPAADSIHLPLWTLGADWVRTDTPCSLYAMVRHWHLKPALFRPAILKFLARLFEERHPIVRDWDWPRLDEYVGPILLSDTPPRTEFEYELVYAALCVLANWACKSPTRGEALRESPAWPRVWEWFERGGFTTAVGVSAFQVLCNAAGPSRTLSLDRQWEILSNRAWERASELPEMGVRRSIHLGGRLVGDRTDLRRTLRRGVLARLILTFGAHDVYRGDVEVCVNAWKAVAGDEVTAATWDWILLACGWDGDGDGGEIDG